MSYEEQEVKLSGSYNNQLKYADGPSYGQALGKIQKALRILEIPYEPFVDVNNVDVYYDTVDFLIKREHCSLRTRGKGKNAEVTLKLDPRDAGEDGLIRTEVSGSAQETLEQTLHSLYQEHFPTGGPLQRQITVINDRHKTIISTQLAAYELSFDKYQYHSETQNYKSSDFYEIEIESQTRLSETDPAIHRLSDFFTEIFDFKRQSKSKYERGIDWLHNPDDLKRKTFLIFDIVGYSLENPMDQKTLIQEFSRLAEKALTRNALFDRCLKLPTGDGIILGFPEGTQVLPLLNEIYEENASLNQTKHLKLAFRTAIHCGPVFTYQDINHSLNYAGDGINCVARICSKADRWQVLVSEDYYQRTDAVRNLNPRYFSNPFSIKVKHGREIQVRNYCQQEHGPGIPHVR